MPSNQEVREATRTIATGLGHANPDGPGAVIGGKVHPIWQEWESLSRDVLIAAERTRGDGTKIP